MRQKRVKLATELSKRDTGKTLYILDEPTTGLHLPILNNFSKCCYRLRDQGNTIVVIEHNLDVIKTADWIVDLGPEGAVAVVKSSPLARRKKSPKSKVLHTARFLEDIWQRLEKPTVLLNHH